MPGKYLVPNEDGILVPSDVPEMHELSPGEKALSLACNSGGSGEGMSHYSQASRCGRRARLSAERYKKFAEDGTALPLTKNHFIIGSVYHKLHELARRDPKDETLVIDFDEQYQNPNVAEGVRLYKGWLRTWGLDFWGKCLGVEVNLADDTTFKSETDPGLPFGEGMGAPGERINVTGQLDMIVEMDAEACERAKKRGLELEPGRRIVDWKSADGPSDGLSYKEGMQSLWYCHLWNLHNPDRPVDGIIFDVVMKRSRRKDRSVLLDDFQAFYVAEGRESVEALRGMVMQGHRNIVEDIPNRSECVTWRGEICPFRTYGECLAT
jgi:hypothetical protein